ncbi:hypothetical protein EJB05_44504 [Eragrostis curvula]|uniref:CASP-like protein n=1 Tax=Eragrostis curvula TaxID=38414 RepID=A0A5J9TJ85_9POAL|nr:hypothetical protein EJB05_44504 [Eragrostis curvula]
MKDIVGSPGTPSGLALRVSQVVCALGSLVAMGSAFGFSNYTAYLYLTFAMSLELLWSFILMCIDIHALRNNRDLHRFNNAWKYVLGDWIFGVLAFAGASAAAGLDILMERDVQFCNSYPYLACSRYRIAVILTCLAWSFLAASAASTFFLLTSFI